MRRADWHIWSLGIVLVSAALSGCGGARNGKAGYRAELLVVHESFLEAHRQNDWEFFRDFADETVYGLRDGEITTQSPEAMGERFEGYLGEARFTRYEDLSEPVVFVSDDGTLGWVMAHVRIEGTYGEGRLDSTWSWLTLLERIEGEWRLVGSASTRGE